jgi:hypothetical protein
MWKDETEKKNNLKKSPKEKNRKKRMIIRFEKKKTKEGCNRKKNQFEKLSKIKQITIKRIRTKFDI